jgi:hypothetical protein
MPHRRPRLAKWCHGHLLPAVEKRSLRSLRWVERLKQWGFDQEKMMVEPGKISADFTW